MTHWHIKTTDAVGSEVFGDAHDGAEDPYAYLARHAQWVADVQRCYVRRDGQKLLVGGLAFEIVGDEGGPCDACRVRRESIALIAGPSALIERARREGFAIWYAGKSPTQIGCGVDDDEGADLYVDQCCSTCGHLPCPCCGVWCDALLGDDAEDIFCCGGECTYERQPRFFLADGSIWEG